MAAGWVYAGSSTPMVSEDGVHFRPRSAAIDTVVKSWCETCQEATASIRVIIERNRYVFVCAKCRNP